jgi:hypothetical protein
MMYLFLAIACMMGPLGAWYAFSADERGARIVRGLLSLLTMGVLLLSLWLCRGWIQRFEQGLLNWANADELFPAATQGAVDEVHIGVRTFVSPLPLVIPVGPGERLQVRGWIRSWDSFLNPITVSLISKQAPRKEIVMISNNQERPDIAKYFADPLLGRSGFLAEVTLPPDFQIGSYRVVIECRGTSWNRFEALNALEGVPRETAEALEKSEISKRVTVSTFKAEKAQKTTQAEQGRKKKRPKESGSLKNEGNPSASRP